MVKQTFEDFKKFLDLRKDADLEIPEVEDGRKRLEGLIKN
jgi:hypothetical protein